MLLCLLLICASGLYGILWGFLRFDGAREDSIGLDGAQWGSVGFDGACGGSIGLPVTWDSRRLDGIRWD